MGKIHFLFGVHNHQPVGNFDHVFAELFANCYRPYFDVLEHFPEIKTTIHFSGPLLEWLKLNEPGFLRRVAQCAAAGTLEIMSGGFYEPILSSLPERDALGQIRMMNRFLEDELGCEAKGLWLAERIWTPELPRILHQAGMRYTVLDDTHFYYAGLEESQLDGYFLTEKHGHPLAVFPISKAMRYGIPFKMPEETLAALGRARDEWGFDAVTYADDGEKFGGWPGTHQWVYEEKWLEKFFQALREHSSWIETVTFSEYLDRRPPTGRIYLPMASYEEMMEWSLPTPAGLRFKRLREELSGTGIAEERFKIFLRGGVWDNFFTKYEESNHLHKRMLLVSEKLARLPVEVQESSGAKRELYRGQCNCAQWHGLFGGLYLNYLRHALYRHLIAAENLIDAIAGQAFSLEHRDFNLDGRDEVIVHHPKIGAIIAPARGGSLIELDDRPACFNLMNLLGRREEIYHAALRESVHTGDEGRGSPQSIHDQVRSKEPGLEQSLFYDRFHRHSFMDHFFGPGTDLAAIRRCDYEEQGDFADGVFTCDPLEPVAEDESFLGLHLHREGRIVQEGRTFGLRMEKRYLFFNQRAAFEVHYRLSHEEPETLNLLCGVELNFTLLAGDAPDRYYTVDGQPLEDGRMASEGVIENVGTLGLCDDWQGLRLTLETAPGAALWRYPVETISQSEGGFERTYQGSCLLFIRALAMAPGKPVEFAFKVGIESRRS
jgi:alpha-amylase